MLEVIIIGDKDGTRIKPLLKTFANDKRFSITLWPPVYLDSFSSQQLLLSGFNVDDSTAYMLRKLSLTEIGCSLAHIGARNFLATREFGGVILEDDARIPNLDYFFASASLFLETIKTPALLNFSRSGKIESFTYTFPTIPVLCKKTTHSSTTVAYVLNKSGAEMIARTKYRLCSVPDWPYAKIDKFTMSHPVVAHGDVETLSTIDPENILARAEQSWRNRILLFSFYHYFKNRNLFGSILEYIKVMLVPRFLFQFHRLTRRF